MRGLSDGAFTGRARSTVGTYLDDTPINYNAPNPDLRLVDVERVETLRGSAGRALRLRRPGRRLPHRRQQARPLDAGRRHHRRQAAWTKGGSPSHEIEGFVNMPRRRGPRGPARGGLLRRLRAAISTTSRCASPTWTRPPGSAAACAGACPRSTMRGASTSPPPVQRLRSMRHASTPTARPQATAWSRQPGARGLTTTTSPRAPIALHGELWAVRT